MNRFKRSYDIHVSRQPACFCSMFENNKRTAWTAQHKFAVCMCHPNVASRMLPIWRGNNIWAIEQSIERTEKNEINEHEQCFHMKYCLTNIQKAFKQPKWNEKYSSIYETTKNCAWTAHDFHFGKLLAALLLCRKYMSEEKWEEKSRRTFSFATSFTFYLPLTHCVSFR